MDEFILENELLKATFNASTGAMTSLVGKQTGWNIVRRPELGLSFRLLVPLPDRHKNYVLGEGQALASSQLSADRKTLTLTWRNLASQHAGTLDITFTGIVRLQDGGLQFEAKVDNRSPYTVEGVAWPCIGDLGPTAGAKELYRLFPAYCTMGKASLLPQHQGEHGYWGTDVPTSFPAGAPESQFMLVEEDDKQGWYFGVHDHRQKEWVSYMFQFSPGYLDYYTFIFPKEDEVSQHTVKLEMSLVHFPFAAPGSSVELSPILVQPYVGGWKGGADVYKKWRREWFRRPRTPQWVTDIHSWLQLQINGSEDDLRYRYSQLPAIAQECKEHGISAIQLVGWNIGGQDHGNPLHDTDPRLGTREELKAAIAKCREIGVRIILFCKFTWADQSQQWYREGGFKHTSKDPYGDPYRGWGYQYQTWTQLADINTRRLIPMCRASTDYQAVAQAELRKVLDLRPAGMLYDESQHHGNTKYCFDKSHNHPQPAHLFGHDSKFIDALKAVSEPVDPDFLYSGEALLDYQDLQYHLTYARMSQLNYNHLQRYIDPMLPMMMASVGFDDRNQLNKCLQHRYIISYEPFNFKGLPNDAPLTLAYGAKVDAFRQKYRAYVWDGEYRDTKGPSVTAAGKAYCDYSVFHQPNGKRAVVVTNMNPDKSVRVQVVLDGGAKGELVTATPEKPGQRKSSGVFTVQPRGVVVLMER